MSSERDFGRGVFPGGGARGVRVAATALAAVSLLSACAGGGLLPAQNDQQNDRASALVREGFGPLPTRSLVETHDAPYISERPAPYFKLPWLQESIEMRTAGLPFDLCLRKALEQLDDPPSVAFSPSLVERSVEVTIDHRGGSFREFLNLLAEATGFGWEERAGALYWTAETTRTVEIHRVPADLTYSMTTGQTEEEEVVRTGQGGGGGSNSGVRASPTGGGIIDLSSEGGFWRDLEYTLDGLLSEEDHRPVIDRTTATVVLRGHPGRVRRAVRYIEALNRWLGRQVMLDVQLVQVTLADDRSAGIDWNLVYDQSDLQLSGESSFAEVGANAISANAGQIGLTFTGGSLENTKLVLHALSQQGETSVVNSPRVVALNGQATQLQVLNDRGYLAGVNVTTLATVTGGTETELQSGVVSTGISLTLVPKIVGEQVFLHANILMSDLISLDAVGAPGQQSIQLPTVERSQFFQSARLRSGETLVLGGLLANRASKSNAKLIPRLPTWLGGAQAVRSSRTETVLLITPRLLDKPFGEEDLLL